MIETYQSAFVGKLFDTNNSILVGSSWATREKGKDMKN